jgi:hypothetical protein
MAGTLALNVEILGEFRKLSAATQGAEGQLKGLNAVADNVSTGMNKAFALIGAAFSVTAIVNGLKQAAEAAIEDVKSQRLLAIAMENTGEATEFQIKQAEENIRQMQFSAGVADDTLRPAFQKLFISTGDVTRASDLLQVALDTSASTGKDLDTVTQAMTRSLEGNDTALGRLVPSLRNAADPLAELGELFRGSAEEAANLDPYTRMQIIFEDMQEQVGMALLPILNEFSTWLATPEGQAKLQEIVDGLVAIIEEGIRIVEWVEQNKDWLVPLVAGISAITAAWKVAIATVGLYRAAVALAGGSSAVAGVTSTAATVAGGTAATVGVSAGGTAALVVAGSALGGYMQGQQLQYVNDATRGANSGLQADGSFDLFGDLNSRPGVQSTTNVTINMNAGNITGQQIADAIRRSQRSTGTNVIQPRQ